MLSVGILLGPQQHVFYKLIDERYPCRTFTHIIRKLMLDQFISSPIYIVSFFVWCSVIERTTYEECIREIKSKFVTIYKIDCMIWPPSQLINFLYFSPKYRMLYVNFTTMIYDIVLSHVKYTAAWSHLRSRKILLRWKRARYEVYAVARKCRLSMLNMMKILKHFCFDTCDLF